MRNRYTADFETCVWEENETWVWAWAVCNIDTEKIELGTEIDDFINYFYNKNATVYFHNLKFDGEFIIYWLLTHGFRHIEDKKDVEDNTFTTLISDMGQFYTITIYFKKWNKKYRKVTFIDSLKIIPLKVEEIPKAFNLQESKLEIDYLEKREKGHKLTIEEQEYIKHDVLIVAKALKMMFAEKLEKMTIGSNALTNYKQILTAKKFEHFFPNLDSMTDKEIRRAYKGGFTYLNPIYSERDVGKTTILDVNSLYPSVLYEKPMPYGEPIFYSGKYQEDKVYPLYIQMITCAFQVKKNHIPTIQIKGNRFIRENEFIESSQGKQVTLVLTCVDLKLFLDHYDIIGNIIYECGWKFKQVYGLFTDYIDKWIKVKIEATKSGNKGKRTIAKLLLNSLYGKFATSLTVQSKIPFLSKEGIVKYVLGEKQEKLGLYIPVRMFYNCLRKRKNN